MHRSRLRALAALAAFGFAAASPWSFAQQVAWPTKPVRIVVTFPPGGAPDTLARVLAEKWAPLGQPITVDNKPGAGGNIGADMVAKAPGDGHTLVVGTVGTHAINAALYGERMPYNHLRDFTPIAFLASTPNLLVVNKTVPANNVKELIELAKKQPLSFGSAGSGTSIHLSGELFNTLAGVKMQHIPYKGRAQAIPDLLGGRAADVRQHAFLAAAGEERRAEGPGRDQRAALAGGAQHSHHRRIGHPRLRGDLLVRPVRLARHPARGADAHQRRDAQGDGHAGREGEARRPRAWTSTPARPRRSPPSCRPRR